MQNHYTITMKSVNRAYWAILAKRTQHVIRPPGSSQTITNVRSRCLSRDCILKVRSDELIQAFVARQSCMQLVFSVTECVTELGCLQNLVLCFLCGAQYSIHGRDVLYLFKALVKILNKSLNIGLHSSNRFQVLQRQRIS